MGAVGRPVHKSLQLIDSHPTNELSVLRSQLPVRINRFSDNGQLRTDNWARDMRAVLGENELRWMNAGSSVRFLDLAL
jgi:hypothetical protein